MNPQPPRMGHRLCGASGWALTAQPDLLQEPQPPLPQDRPTVLPGNLAGDGDRTAGLGEQTGHVPVSR